MTEWNDHADTGRRDFTSTTAMPLLTIGYGSERSLRDFFGLLDRYGVKYLVDVRSRPYSKFRPEFSTDALAAVAAQADFVYVSMGDALGGMPDDPDCYTNGKVDYHKLGARSEFVHGLERLEKGWRGGHRIAIMCAELQPQRCHRAKLIGVELAARGVSVGHIDADGDVLTHQAVMEQIEGGQGSLFAADPSSQANCL